MRHDELFGFSILAALTALSTVACGGNGGDNGNLYGQGGGAGMSSGGGGSGNAAGAGGSGGTPVDLEKQIDPIAVGRKWTYDVVIYGTYAYCQEGVHSGQVLSEKEVAGRHAYQIQSLCPAAGVSSYAVDGDRVWVYYGGEWVLALDAPVEAGHTWSNGITMLSWESVGTMTVPAGTFDDCWSARENVEFEAFTIFCRGVGPIQWHLKTTAGNGFDAKLTEKNF